MRNNPLNSILDGIDIETFISCKNVDEGKSKIFKIMEDFGLNDIKIVFIEHNGPGARVRARGHIHKPGDSYGWLSN